MVRRIPIVVSAVISQHVWKNISTSDLLPKKSYKTIHCRISGLYARNYWLNILIPASFTLGDLDGFLRDIWVECCGHLSEFSIEKPFQGGPLSMNRKLYDIATEVDKIHYVYDFGSSTELEITFISHHPVNLVQKREIVVLARNAPPEYLCCECEKKIAAVMCFECLHEGDGGIYCEQCAKMHDCFLNDSGNYNGEYAVPIPNSPRAGVCGYTGL